MANKNPKKIVVTVSRLETHHDDIVAGATVSFKVSQSGSVVLEDTVNGKCTGSYRRAYEVDASEGDLLVEHNRSDLAWLNISANFE